MQVTIVVLVIFDILLVLAELLFDLEVVQLQGKHQETVPEVLHYCSIAILSLFIVEIFLRIFVMRLQFFKHKLEVRVVHISVECALSDSPLLAAEVRAVEWGLFLNSSE